MRYASALLALWEALGCGGKDPAHVDAAIDAAVVPWWHPAPGEAKNWDIQLHAPFDVTSARTMYELELWDLVPVQTMLDYGDGDPVTVPAGGLAGKLAELHGRTPSTIVICHVDTGAIELDRPDARKFAGYQANPPDDPTPPNAGSVIGWSASRPAERFLDISDAHRALFAALIWKRLDLAVQIGCDGVAADRNDMITSHSGFAITPFEQGSWFREVASQAHGRLLSVGLLDANEISGQVDDLAADLDWGTPHRCGEYNDCDTERAFINLNKAVLAIDYATDIDGMAQSSTTTCPRQQQALVVDGIIKDAAETSMIRTQCTP